MTTAATPEAVEGLAQIFAPHTQRVGANDTEFWAYCTCDPDHVFSPRTGSPASAMDAQWVRDVDQAHREHVASVVLDAGYVHLVTHLNSLTASERLELGDSLCREAARMDDEEDDR